LKVQIEELQNYDFLIGEGHNDVAMHLMTSSMVTFDVITLTRLNSFGRGSYIFLLNLFTYSLYGS
jgi:hypothetical protein